MDQFKYMLDVIVESRSVGKCLQSCWLGAILIVLDS
jgi:hypothetical protein